LLLHENKRNETTVIALLNFMVFISDLICFIILILKYKFIYCCLICDRALLWHLTEKE